MARDFKISFIGAGSFRFSIGLFRNIIAAKEFFPFEACLHDIDATSLDIMTRILNKMVEKSSSSVKVTSTLDRRECLTNADFVYKSISVGIQESEWIDIHLPHKLGIPQNTGDTCGPGGLFRGLRCVPPVQAIARDMKELCPKAVLLNYTNPQATIVMGARRISPDLQYVGLCHELFGGMGTIKAALNHLGIAVNDWHDLDIRYGGVNHFTWLTSVKDKNGDKDLYPLLREHKKDLAGVGGRAFNWYLFDKHDYFPIPGSRHVAEFMPEYYNFFNHEAHSKPPFKFPLLRDVYLLGKGRKAAYWGFRRMAGVLGKHIVPGATKRGEKALDMTLDWRDNNPAHHVVNIPNKGFIPNLPEGAIVEVPGFFKDGKMVGVSMGPLPGPIADLVRPHAEQQSLTVDAAEGNDPDLVIKAMLHDPMNKFIEDEDRIVDLTWHMLYHEQQWLPTAWKEWMPSKDDLAKRKYHVDEKEIKNRKVARQNKYPVNESLRSKAIFYP